MAVYLIRHGQSTVNAANVEANYSGLAYHEEQYWDAPLNETGVDQAREAAKQFSSSAEDQGCVTLIRFRLCITDEYLAQTPLIKICSRYIRTSDNN